ncbi:MAG: exonuclease domain-containing protein [Lachnospiraceae bacterium]|nr:exonuclease domain-containing protein [Lachnospiraceae bacterium]
MEYIVLDLEWNQCPYGKDKENKKLPFEIIEIGAVKLNSKRECVDKFSMLVKPTVYREFHYYTKNMLHLSMQDLKNQESFPVVMEKFLNWCGEDYIFCTWGSSDLMELQRNMEYHDMKPLAEAPFKYYDIQKIYTMLFEDDKKVRRSLEYAVDRFDILKTAAFHRAKEDAVYTGRIMQYIRLDDMEHHYSIDTYHRPKNKKSEVYALFDNYSKYISREFASKEEAMADREVASSRCCLCGKNARKKIRWFSGNGKIYLCQAYCEHHGFIRGKVRMKKTDSGRFYVIKTLKLVSEEEAQMIRDKQNEVRKRRREKRKNMGTQF